MRKLPWFISLRYQGLLAIVVIAMTLLGVLAYSPATTLASHEQKANAERWLDHLLQNLIRDRFQEAHRLLAASQPAIVV